MNIGVIGMGYVGLVTAACLTKWGHNVIGVDQSAEKVTILSSGGLPIREPGLEDFIRSASEQSRIRFTTEAKVAISQSEVLFIAVGTPPLPDGQADISQIEATVEQIAEHGHDQQLIIIKSTVPIGTTDLVASKLKQKSTVSFLDVIHNPEFLRQGQAIHDFLFPDRIVIGFENPAAKQVMQELYEPLDSPFIFCDRKSSEMIKYASNAFLAMKISYINMLARLSEKAGANIDHIAKGMGADRRIGSAFLQAGIGYGGSCFPKDTQALIAMGRQLDSPLPLIEATEQINREQPIRFLHRLEELLGTLNQKKIALFGLSFKANTDDIREAPSLKVSRLCLQKGAEVHAYDPVVKRYPVEQVQLHHHPYTALDQADALIFLTDWEEFRQLHWSEVRYRMRTPLILDGRNLFHPEEMSPLTEEYGLIYYSVGRPLIRQIVHSN